MAKRTINAKGILADIKAGMDDSILMARYQLSDKGLQSLFKKLADAGLLKQGDLGNRSLSTQKSVDKVLPHSEPSLRPAPTVASGDPIRAGARTRQNNNGLCPPTKSESGFFVKSKAVLWTSLGSFLCKAILWGAVTFVLGNAFAIYPFWIVVLSVFLLTIPIALGRIYGSTIKQISGLAKFASQGWFFRLMSRRIMRVILWIIWALVFSFFMLVQFHTYNSLEWTAFFLVIPVFYAIFATCRRFLAQELKKYLVIGVSLRWATVLTPIIMLAVYMALITQFGNVPKYATLDEAIIAQKAALADMTGSALAAETSQWLALYNGAKAFALGNLAAYDSLLALAILAIGGWAVFFNACAMLTCFLIPGKEYRRIFSPLSAEPELPPIPPRKIAVIFAVTTFLVLFIYVPLFASLEAWMQRNPQVAEIRKKVEQVGSDYVNEGTVAKIKAAKLEALHKVEISLSRVEAEADRAFDRMEINVDLFLDWYYSLPAEYARIANLLIGNLEDYLRDKLTEYLRQGAAFQSFETALDDALANHKSVLEEYNQTVRKIINENLIDVSGMKFHVVQSMTLDDALNSPIHKDHIDFNKRMIAGAGAGTIAGTMTAVITKKIISKIIGKATLKKAAQVLAKVVASKVVGSAGGAAAGAAAGAAIGSVVPGVGTVIGAAIGGIAGGLVVGVTVDKLFLMLEEALSRDDFKRELIESIEDTRKDFKKNLRGNRVS
jgi:hypothetical protein